MKDDRKFLKRWDWSCVLMDEAHLLKDRGSYRSKRLRDIAHSAKQRLMLTGTPLQNDLQVISSNSSGWQVEFVLTFVPSLSDCRLYLGL